MSPDTQRIAIAEACGWKIERAPGYSAAWFCYDPMRNPKGHAYAAPHEAADVVPDYLNDLNAMHEAEKVLTARHRTVFELEVLRLTTGKERFDYDRGDLIAVITATAAQRAEAFLRTLGKWEESS